MTQAPHAAPAIVPIPPEAEAFLRALGRVAKRVASQTEDHTQQPADNERIPESLSA